ncbi:MAG: hypothetical protein U5K36_06020 [Roseovarius sp.]|nr:hypothetical protein [Roseovarius sp.]
MVTRREVGRDHEGIGPRTAAQHCIGWAGNEDVVTRATVERVGPEALRRQQIVARCARKKRGGVAAGGGNEAEPRDILRELADTAPRIARHKDLQLPAEDGRADILDILQPQPDVVRQSFHVQEPPVGQQAKQAQPVICPARDDEDMIARLRDAQPVEPRRSGCRACRAGDR